MVTQDIWQDRRVQYAIGIFGIVGLFAACWFGYAWYQSGKEQAAYKDLAESIDSYVSTQRFPQTKEKLIDIEGAFSTAAGRHKGSNLHPYFLVFEADALVRAGKLDKATELMDQVLGEMPKGHALYYLYGIKTALMKLDSDSIEIQKQGHDALKALAQESIARNGSLL